MKLLILNIITVIIFLSNTNLALPEDTRPILAFSDINSGPKTGLYGNANPDGQQDEGVIVTVWGYNLGEKKDLAAINDQYNVYCGGQKAAKIYYWGKADGSNGPSDLSKSHNMQEISFSISPAAKIGDGIIYVEVPKVNDSRKDPIRSNSIPFNVKDHGRIFHVTKSGDDQKAGSWGAPWATISLDANGRGNWSKLAPGDTVYLHDGVQEVDRYNDTTRMSGMKFSEINGNNHGVKGDPISIIAYPKANVLARGKMYGIYIWVPYVNISKIRIEAGNSGDRGTTGRSTGIAPGRYARLIGNYITDRKDIAGPDGCADGGSGAIGANAANNDDRVSGLIILGNTITKWGCQATQKFEHTTYLSNRSGSTGNAIDVDGWEFGYNLLEDNMARGGIHAYDENLSNSNRCGDIKSPVLIHDNVIKNQRGAGIFFGTNLSSNATTNCWSPHVLIYNNFLINAGIGPNGDNFAADTNAISVSGRGTSSQVLIRDNTIVWTEAKLSEDQKNANGTNGMLYIPDGSLRWNGKVTWENNIVYVLDGTKEVNCANIVPSELKEEAGRLNGWLSAKNNIWYGYKQIMGKWTVKLCTPEWNQTNFQAPEWVSNIPDDNSPKLFDDNLNPNEEIIENIGYKRIRKIPFPDIIDISPK